MSYAATDTRMQEQRPSALAPCAGCALVLGDDVRLYLGDCLDIMPLLTGIDSVISDPPFSARTHAGHDAIEGDGYDSAKRGKLGYEPWGDDEVKAVCAALPMSGWTCILTDHVLARDWERRMKEVGRYVFAPIPVIVKGRSVRLTGDGPSSWTDWMVPSRTKAEIKWGTLPGVYEGVRGSIEHMGGKPLNAMCRIVEDYSRPGDTVLDFCMGAATTAIACIRTGRKFIGIEKDPQHFDTARQRIERELSQGRLAL
jgi:site-specific DNA-methyltransferase (adenine-specific)